MTLKYSHIYFPYYSLGVFLGGRGGKGRLTILLNQKERIQGLKNELIGKILGILYEDHQLIKPMEERR